DETFDFGPRGDLAYDAVGPLLLNVGCFPDASSARAFFQTLAARFGDAHAAASAENVRSLGAPMRMGEGMAEQALLGEGKTGVIQAVAAEGEEESMYFVTERDLRKLERNKRKDERQRMVGLRISLRGEGGRGGRGMGEGGRGGRGVGNMPFLSFAAGTSPLQNACMQGEAHVRLTDDVYEAHVKDAYEAHVKESEAILSSMPLVTVSHGGDGTEGGAKDIHLSNFTVTVAGKDLISDASITLAFGRRYGFHRQRSCSLPHNLPLLRPYPPPSLRSSHPLRAPFNCLTPPLNFSPLCPAFPFLPNTAPLSPSVLVTSLPPLSALQALERIGTVDSVVADPEYRFEFPTPEDRPQAPIISFTDVNFGYPGGPLLFKNLNFGIDLDSRLAIVGPNGIGKTTLLKLISGELKPTSGTAFRSPKVRMAVFAQHHVDGLELSKSPLLYMAHSFPGVPEQKLRAHLGSFGLGGNLALQPMYTLSGGQKSRVSFAKITFHKPHILLLDEPSNHLDIDAVEALIQGLALFQGGVLMVSHDEHLISGGVDQLWAVDKGVAKPFSGTFKEYKRSIKH
ncbi:unnamed protein product, partial [Closterium sp. Naga37s-1]